MIEISSKVILVNGLLVKKSLTSYFLKKVKNQICSNLGKELIYVDVTNDSVCSAVEINPDLFYWNKNKVIRAKNSENFYNADYIDKFINGRLPKEISDLVKRAISQSN